MNKKEMRYYFFKIRGEILFVIKINHERKDHRPFRWYPEEKKWKYFSVGVDAEYGDSENHIFYEETTETRANEWIKGSK